MSPSFGDVSLSMNLKPDDWDTWRNERRAVDAKAKAKRKAKRKIAKASRKRNR